MSRDHGFQASLIDLLNRVPDHVAICAADGDILFVNEAWHRFAFANGYAGADFSGQNYFDV